MKASFDSTGHVLVVTGGANGIGAAAALGYAAAGGTSVVLDIEPSPVLEGRARLVQHEVDVSDRAAVFAVFEEILATHGRIDGLIAGAAVQPRVDIADMDPDVWRRTLSVNLDGVVWACQAALPTMVERGRGSIVMFGSGLVASGHPQASAYAASKGALAAFGKSLAAEVVGYGVRVNIVLPGVIDTPQFRRANAGAARDDWERGVGVGVPDDVVGPLLFLLSGSGTMTGSVLTRERVFPERHT